MSSGTTELCDLTAVEIAGSVKSRKLSAVEVTEAHLARMEALEPKLHAFRASRPAATAAQPSILAQATRPERMTPYWPEPADGGNLERER